MAEQLWRALLDLTHGAAGGDFPSMLERVTETACRVVGIERASIWVEDEAGEHLIQKELFIRSTGQHFRDKVVPRAQLAPFLELLQSEQTAAISHAQSDPRTDCLKAAWLEPMGINSMIAGSILVGGRSLGLVALAHVGPPREWTSGERQFVGSIGDYVALLIEGDRRRSAEATLDRQRAYLRQVIDLNPHLIFAKDRAGRFTLINKAVAEVYGTTVEELLGKCDADFNSNAEEVAHFLEQDRLVMDTGRETLVPEERITDASGKVRWLQTIKRPIFDADGHAEQVLGVATDITLRKSMEEERLRLARELRQVQKLESIGVLAGGVAHDFNNLLTPILASAEQGLADLPASHPVRELFHEVIEAGLRAKDLTSQLLAFGRKQMLELRAVDLNEEIRSAAKILSRLVPEHVRIELDLGPSLPAVRADPVQIQQVLLNLVVNAKDAMPQGGSLIIGTSSADVDGAAKVILRVRDTGEGIPPEALPRLFEPFYTTKAFGRGTGLGLSTVYGIVEQHGGSITVESALGRGTAFRVVLPVDALASPAAERASSRPGARPRTETVLVVEDDPQVLVVVARALRRHGLKVLTAIDAKDALAEASAIDQTIHLLVTDVIMPGMNGRELYEALQKTRPNLQVLFMSGHAQEVLGPRGFLDKGVRLLRKPFTGNELLLKIQDVLDSGVPGSRDITPADG